MDNQIEPVAPVGAQAPATPQKQWVRVIAPGIDLRAMGTKFTGFITKYALTTGVIETQLEQSSNFPNMVTALSLGHHAHFHGEGKEWHRNRECALARAEEMRLKKLASLRKSIKTLESRAIDVVSR